jgi:hypothetical protein
MNVGSARIPFGMIVLKSVTVVTGQLLWGAGDATNVIMDTFRSVKPAHSVILKAKQQTKQVIIR